MWDRKHVVGTVISAALIFLSLADAPEQLAKWKSGWDRFVANAGIDWAAFWVGPSGRLTLFLTSIAVGLWSWEVPQRLWSQYIVSRRQAGKEGSFETGLRVRATKMGFYGNVRRREGDVFDLKAGDRLGKWMQPVSPDTPEKVTTSAQALRREEAELRGENPEDADEMRIRDLERVKEQALAHGQHQAQQLLNLANRIQEISSERDQARKSLSELKRNFALWRLRAFCEKHPETKVTIRYVESRDLPIVDTLADVLKQHTKWDVHIDGRNDPILRPDATFKVLVSAGGFLQFESVVAALADGGFVDCVVGQRMSGVDDYSLITIEVLPTVTP